MTNDVVYQEANNRSISVCLETRLQKDNIDATELYRNVSYSLGDLVENLTVVLADQTTVHMQAHAEARPATINLGVWHEEPIPILGTCYSLELDGALVRSGVKMVSVATVRRLWILLHRKGFARFLGTSDFLSLHIIFAIFGLVLIASGKMHGILSHVGDQSICDLVLCCKAS